MQAMAAMIGPAPIAGVSATGLTGLVETAARAAILGLVVRVRFPAAGVRFVFFTGTAALLRVYTRVSYLSEQTTCPDAGL
jgi:hypothetical protein